ncbi:MAG: protein YgfX [Betaproteobacteria bacterium]
MPDRLSLQITPSRIEGIVLTAAHAIALMALWLAPLPMPVAIPATIVILINLAVAYRMRGDRAGLNAALGIEFREGGAVALQRRDGEWREYSLDGSTFVSPLVAVINLRKAGSRRTTSILVTSGSLDPTLFRRLRVWLKWRGLANLQPDPLSDTH